VVSKWFPGGFQVVSSWFPAGFQVEKEKRVRDLILVSSCQFPLLTSSETLTPISGSVSSPSPTKQDSCSLFQRESRASLRPDFGHRVVNAVQ